MSVSSEKTLRLSLLTGRFAVCRFAPEVDPGIPNATIFYSITRTPDELSIVCEESSAPDGAEVEAGWRALKVEGPLEFSETGVISSLTRPLADAKVPVFVVSTFDTDYLFVKETDLERTTATLTKAGFGIEGSAI